MGKSTFLLLTVLVMTLFQFMPSLAKGQTIYNCNKINKVQIQHQTPHIFRTVPIKSEIRAKGERVSNNQKYEFILYFSQASTLPTESISTTGNRNILILYLPYDEYPYYYDLFQNNHKRDMTISYTVRTDGNPNNLQVSIFK